MIIGADVGGTFTDVVGVDDGVITSAKVPTTRPQSDGVVDGAYSIADGRRVTALVHGTTVATNALLERAGARTALVTDAGFEDVIEIGRQDRPSLYDPFSDRSEPLVIRSLRFGIDDVADVPDLASVEAAAIAFVDGHRDPTREQAVANTLAARHPDLAISMSSAVSPEFREFERVSTTVLNAYLTPIMSSYLRRLQERIEAHGLADSVSVMRSSGGMMSIEAAEALPAAALLSGPAGGVVATQNLAETHGLDRVVSFDMGGTSTDVCLVEDGAVDVSYERDVDGFVCRLPSVGIHTVGAGGGSVAWIDTGGALRVGPQSAGSDPGPACHGRGGTHATVTDANVVLGRIAADARLGGTLEIDGELSRGVVAGLAGQLGMDIVETALGIVRIAESTMAGAVRSVSIDRGSDPTEAHLVAFGGAGGLHASAVARSLGMAGVVVPPFAGVFSALGLLLAPPRADGAAAVHEVEGGLGAVKSAVNRLESTTGLAIEAAGHEVTRADVELDVRYIGQAHEIGVPWDRSVDFAGLSQRFSQLHARRYGFSRQGDPIEIVAARVASFGTPPIVELPLPPSSDGSQPTHRTVVTSTGRSTDAVVMRRASLQAGDTFVGPLLVEDEQSTTWVDEQESMRVLPDGSLELTW